MNLPEEFLKDIQKVLPADEFEPFTKALSEDEQVTSIRINRKKVGEDIATFSQNFNTTISTVGWCPEGLYLQERPQFTTDPLLHAGAYYVQEASSMFITHVLRSQIKDPVCCLDLCAAPGGKSTAALSALPEGSQLVSNEIDRRRARILAENISKWGNPNVTVTSNAPADFRKLKHVFDVIITDVPCSGEGMFRKDEGAITDWSPSKVEGCAKLQHEILDSIWECLKPGGLLIYSTCTFNVHEDEEMVKYICEELGAEAISIPTEDSWNIHSPLIGERPCYRFMPHFTKGEGLFMAAMRKDDGICQPARLKKPLKSKVKVAKDISNWVNEPSVLTQNENGIISAIPLNHKEIHDLLEVNGLYMLQSGIELGEVKGKDIIPSQNLALSTALSPEAFSQYEVQYTTALDYLRRQAFTLPSDAPTGYIILTYKGYRLGFVKNLGNRCNNLYPQEWRIRNL